jgi:hypothetical protein
LELKFEQKSGTSLHTTHCMDATSFKTVERLSVPVIYFDIRAGMSETTPYLEYAKDYHLFLFFCTACFLLVKYTRKISYNQNPVVSWESNPASRGARIGAKF